MTRADSIAQATRRFIDADRKHAVARAKAAATTAAADELARNHAAYRKALRSG